MAEGNYTCSGSTPEELEFEAIFDYWSEGVVNLAICCVGVVANCVSIPVLCSKSMDSVFNKLLVFLAVFDNLFLVLTLLDCFRRHLGTFPYHIHLYGYALYGLHNIVFTCSIYMTVFLAMERYLAVSRPVEYFNSVNSGRRWLRIARYVLPVIVLSIVFNVPKFFELRAVERTVAAPPSGDNVTMAPSIRVGLVPTQLRLNQVYSFYYNNAARLLVIGIIPFFFLVVFNLGIYKAVSRRRRGFNRAPSIPGAMTANSVTSATSASSGTAASPRDKRKQSQQQHYSEENNRQAILLFVIVVFFLVFHTPRNFLNFYEVARFDQIKRDYDHGCGGLPLAVLIVGSVSHVLLTINASVNFFLYCFMSTLFRLELKMLLQRVLSRLFGRENEAVANVRLTKGNGTCKNMIVERRPSPNVRSQFDESHV